MAEAQSPNPTTTQKQRAPFSPTSPFFLGSNDDKLERAQARAARAAAIRRKTTATTHPALADPYLGKQQILELFQNCIKLASENKINQKNTWELGLIDHLCDIVKIEEEDDVETNFQKASCTLEAGVKIYSMRVDSVHSEAYKVLGGINRVGQENEQGSQTGSQDSIISKEQWDLLQDLIQKTKTPAASTPNPSCSLADGMVEDARVNSGEEEGYSKKEQEKKTSAQFDEGGAKGLLLNNLGVYGGCRVLFDSLEVPGKCMSCAVQHDRAEAIDISFAKESIEQMMLNMPKKDEISPSLREIVNQFDEDSQRPLDAFSSCQKSAEQNCGTWAFDHDDQTSVVDEGNCDLDPTIPNNHEDNEGFTFHEPDVDDRFDKVDGYLFLSLGFLQNKTTGQVLIIGSIRKPEEASKENGSPLTTKKPLSRKQGERDIDFTKALDNDTPDIFAPPKNPKSLLLPANRTPCNTTLPEDCHYQPEDLVKSTKDIAADESSQQRDDDGPLPSWDDGGFDGQYDDENSYSNVEDSSTLVSQPRQVNKIEVQYDKTSKQVDVQALKETLWSHIQNSNQMLVQAQEDTVSFRDILATFPNDCKAAASLQDLSPHLCFICLLHLANEHGLGICGSANLDDLNVRLPLQCDVLQGAVI
ncbi:unnamed protein product [Ilex paraguariensis]|uniref:Condensin complex subunit 2 n=1 Tax=Ilex paraguariensis TaxID=185542 RepID=A0ABC8RMJ3_9AQUA